MAEVFLQCPHCHVTWAKSGGERCFCCDYVGEPRNSTVKERQSARDASGAPARVFLPPNLYRSS